MFHLGVITDEVSQSLSEAIAFVKAFGMDVVELRSVEGKGPFEWTADDVQKMADELHAAGIRVAGISAPLFKCDIADEQAIWQHVEGFRRCAAFAKVLGCRIIRGFDFWQSGATVEERARQYAPIIRLCEEHDVICALEYDPSVHSSTAALLAETLAAIDSPRIRALFDPGNGLFSDAQCMPYPHDYEALKPMLCHIHIKDAITGAEGTQAVCPGKGRVDYPALLTRLLKDGYEGDVMLETHYRLHAELTEEQMRLPGGAAFSDGAYEASVESMRALQQMIKTAKEETLC